MLRDTARFIIEIELAKNLTLTAPYAFMKVLLKRSLDSPAYYYTVAKSSTPFYGGIVTPIDGVLLKRARTSTAKTGVALISPIKLDAQNDDQFSAHQLRLDTMRRGRLDHHESKRPSKPVLVATRRRLAPF